MSSFNDSIIEEFRSNRGKVSGGFKDSTLLLLTSTGSTSGKEHTTPLVYTKDGDLYVVVASKGGADTNPDWFGNLKINSKADIEVGDEKFRVDAEIVDEAKRQKIYAKHAKRYPGFIEYQKQTHRKIPVVLLKRIN